MRLGDMSYSIYLLHGLVLDAAFSSPTIVQVALSSSAAYWLVILVLEPYSSACPRSPSS